MTNASIPIASTEDAHCYFERKKGGIWGFFEYLTLSQLNPLFREGSKRVLRQEDLGDLVEEDKVESLRPKFEEEWKKELMLDHKDRSLWRPLKNTIGYKTVIIALVLQAISSAAAFGPPNLLKVLCLHFSGFPGWHLEQDLLWFYVCLVLVVPIVGVLAGSQSYVRLAHLSCKVRAIIIPTVYRKAIILSSEAKMEFSTGRIINLFSNDINHIVTFSQSFAEPIFSLPQLAAALGLIYNEMGNSMFAGFGLVVVSIPLMLINIRFFIHYRSTKMVFGDLRIKLTNEILMGIRVLKYYAWERAFAAKIDEVREKEIKNLAGMNYLIVVFMIIIMSIPNFMPIAIFYTYVASGNEFDAIKAFVTLALLSLVQTPIMLLPQFIQGLALAAASGQRILEFLLSTEISPYIKELEKQRSDEGVVIDVMNASFGWTDRALPDKPEAKEEVGESNVSKSNENEREGGYTSVNKGNGEEGSDKNVQSVGIELTPSQADKNQPESESESDAEADAEKKNRSINTLVDIDFTIKRGQLVAIVGPVGSGKSSLLCGLLGELRLKSGEIYMSPNQSVAYHQQQPWIINATVRDNIIFGKPLDEKRLERAIAAAALEPDIAILQNGLDTEIGEKGINLSGGQKARISFARTVYRDADIYYLDDPLSAVDSHVCEHIFHNGIRGALSGKTVLLVTHQVQLIDHCDMVIVLGEGGKIKSKGAPGDVKNAGIDLNALLVDKDNIDNEEEDQHTQSQNKDGDADTGDNVHTAHAGTTSTSTSKASDSDAITRPKSRSRTGSSASNRDSIDSKGSSSSSMQVKHNRNKDTAMDKDKDKESDNNKKKDTENLLTTEELSAGSVKMSIYIWFLKQGGLALFCVSFLFGVAGNASNCYSGFYLAQWGTDAMLAKYTPPFRPFSAQDNVERLNIFALLIGMYALGTTCRTIMMITMGIRASKQLHRALLNRVLQAPISFFDTTPIGRILNRFSSDITSSDEGLAYQMGFIIGLTSNLLGLVGNIAYSTNGTFLGVLVPIGFVYYQTQLYFRASNTAFKRIENNTRSPIYVEFNQALLGVTSLRAFKEEDQFIKRMERNVDINSVPMMLQTVAKWWLGIRLDCLGALVSFFIAALAAGKPDFIPTKYIALALQNSFAITGLLKTLVNYAALVEAMMNSIERIKYYTETIEQEEDDSNADSLIVPPEDWPSNGKIEFEGVEMRYRQGPLVLKGISMTVNPMEKIGVAGRTGSGKSSLMVTLFRMEKLAAGKIMIDGLDIDKISLQHLRSRLGIIPQDPVMFAQTVRYNLDPFSHHTDPELWSVLDSVQMKDAVMALPKQLDEMVAEGGGELFCRTASINLHSPCTATSTQDLGIG